jgi:hypothetical protein
MPFSDIPDVSTPEDLLRNLLAVIHRDGGHYAAEHGLVQATRDALTRYYVLVQQTDLLQVSLGEYGRLAAAMRMLLDDYAGEVAHRDAVASGGQHVGHTNGVFTSAPPSVMQRFDRLMRDAKVLP